MTQTEERAADIVDAIEFDDTLPMTDREEEFYKAGYDSALVDARGILRNLKENPTY